MIGSFRVKKMKGETFHQKGQKVWLKNNEYVTVKPQARKSFGEVVKDSVYPDLWVTVNIWNKEEFSNWFNKDVPKAVIKNLKRRIRTRDKTPRGKMNQVELKKDTIQCFCGSLMSLFFNEAKQLWYFRCAKFPNCKGTHGCHQGSLKPLGIPADGATKGWRVRAHEAFDKLWRGPGAKISRNMAYEWLAREMKKPKVHIGEMFHDDCVLVIELSERKLKQCLDQKS